MALVFISSIVPDKEPYNGKGFARSGNNVLLGIAESLPIEEDTIFLSCRPIASFPRGPLWIKSETIDTGLYVIHILPTLNIKIIKGLYWGLIIKRIIRKWSKANQESKRKVLVYNIYSPPISTLYKICKKTHTKLFAILYDLGIPPKHLTLSKMTMMGYRYMARIAKKYIPKLDGRIVINETISKEYARGKSYLLIDGGINSEVINLLPNLYKREPNKQLVITLCGLLWEQNGTRLILECLEKHPDLDVIVCFAGKGVDVGLIEERSVSDKRIRYLGLLSQEEIFKLYEISDVLLNLRIEEPNDMHFPSKLLEYIATGKHVISTSIAHAERDYGEFMTVLQTISENSLYLAIKNIMDSDPKDIYEQGKLARQFMISNRNWGKRTSEILNYINDICND